MPFGSNHRAHSRENYGRASGVSAWWRPDGLSGAADWKHLGSLTGIQKIPRDERLAHFTNVLGERTKDAEVVTQRELAIEFTLEEINLHNLQLAFGSGVAAVAGTKDAKFARVVKNPGAAGTIKIGQTNVKNVVLRSPSLEGAEVTYVEGVGQDYTVDLPTGVVTILAGGDLENPATVKQVHVYAEKEVDVQKFEIFPGLALEGEFELHIIGKGGLKRILTCRGVLRNNGAMPVGDGTQWEQIPMTLEALADENSSLGEAGVVNAGEIA